MIGVKVRDWSEEIVTSQDNVLNLILNNRTRETRRKLLRIILLVGKPILHETDENHART